ncbi:hypothetical protein FIU87_02030 [Bacillus sp. THAF10]|uniref:DUF2812 domain-containing protein n=1 Tax=Bacillus sp. THAF10 TaxID=2587848 RepID=UPI001267C7C0|nr:DUF2812 domain-containing protein [Bacillus sp. THAF10]QFT87419.1 hypothetical protein FIU87_02030 [Bacillus sp. THAF10]
MKKIKRKFIQNLFINFEKEEAWLNQMCEDGLALCEITKNYYAFEPCEPGAYIYRIEFLKPDIYRNEIDSYLTFMEDVNVELIASSRRWHYFRRKSSYGEFEIYSDFDSRIEHYKRINIIWYMLSIPYLATSITQIFSISNMTKSELVLNALLFLIGILFLCLALPLTKRIKNLQKNKALVE